MKRILTGLFVFTTSMVVLAQNETNALLFSFNRPTGTARSISLGGAMGALGGDYSSIGINPAGLAVYRSSEFTFTPSITYNKTKSSYYGTKSKEDRFSFPLQQIGFVGTYKPMREATSGLISTHFSIGYTRNNSFSRKTFIQGRGIGSSLLDEFLSNSNGNTPPQLNDFSTGIAYDVELLDLLPGFSDSYINGFEYIENDTIKWGPLNGINQGKVISERGNSGEFAIAGGANFSNKIFIGGSLGIATLDYSMKSQHYEEAASGVNGIYADGYYDYRDAKNLRVLENFTYKNDFSATGVGVNLKVGVIYKPVNSLRVGAAIHTPTFYSIDFEYENDISAKYEDGTTILPESAPYGESSYNFRTPWKFIGSLAYIIGDKGLISFDYERTDYGSMKYKSQGSSLSETLETEALNNTISSTFKGTNILRFGAEFRATDALSFRGGYATYRNPYKKLYLNSNGYCNTYSLGLGYKVNNMFIDFAYILRHEKEIHSLYYSTDINEELQEPADITTKNHQVAVTLGWKF